MATTQTGTDRWKALDFGPPPSGEAEPDQPVLADYVADGHVAVITLNRPHADNAITTEMGVRLTEILETIAVRPSVRVAIITGAGTRAFSVGSDLRQRKDMTQRGLAAPASGLRSHALHAAAAAKADLRRRERDRLRRRLRDRPEHRLHHRLRERHLRPARSDDRPRGRRRLTGLPSPRSAAGESAADADDRRPDHRGRGLPPGDGQRAPPAGRADGRCAPDRGEDREQLADGRTGGQGRRAHGRGAADRAGDRDHDGRRTGAPPSIPTASRASAPSTTTATRPSRTPTTDASVIGEEAETWQWHTTSNAIAPR